MSRTARRILVADSDYAFAQALRTQLEARGLGVEVVSDGLSAINLVKTRPFAGAVIDTDLIGVDGLQVLGVIRDFKRALPVVITSKRGRLEIEPQIRRAGAGAFIAKPTDAARVAESLQECMTGGPSEAPRKRPEVSLAQLKTGQALLVECPGGQVEGRLSSRLIAKHPASLAVAAPRREGEPVSLPFGVPVTVGFPMPDGWYYFDTYVLGAVSYSGQPALLLAQPKLVSHIQRRRYVRTRGEFAVEIETAAGVMRARGRDASEGGMCVVAESALAVGAQVACRIEAGPADDRISLPGAVVWAQELRDNGQRCRAGVRFSPGSGAERKWLRVWLEGLAQGANPGDPERISGGLGASAMLRADTK